MNKLTFFELKNIISIVKSYNIEENLLFDYFRICNINDKKYEDKAENPLYFLSYSTNEETKNGWYLKPFDLREHLDDIIEKYPKATIVIDRETENSIKNKKVKYIVVENISEAIDELFSYIKNRAKAKVIAVTGSVGKTTLAGLIEQLLKGKFKVLRIYSKRITPIILKAQVINFLTPEIDFVVLENSIYYHNHVKVLSSLLNPYIACILNIHSSHLGVEKLKTLDDICKYKAEIFRNAKIGLINIDNEYLRKLELEDDDLKYDNTYLFKTSLEMLDEITIKDVIIKDSNFMIDKEITIKPFILSDLAILQYYMAYRIGKIVGLTNREVAAKLQNYVPVENRLNTEKAFNKEIIFDGDITTYERISELANLKYSSSYLVIRKVGSSENTFRIADITKHFNKFTKVFIFADIEYLEELKNHSKVIVVNNHDFLKNITGKIIYHYSGYYRVWKEFMEANLHIYDKEIYPIKKENKEN